MNSQDNVNNCKKNIGNDYEYNYLYSTSRGNQNNVIVDNNNNYMLLFKYN